MIVSGLAWAGQATVGHAVIIGGSDIGKGLAERLLDDGWDITQCKREEIPEVKWDLLIIPQGTMLPIGRYVDCDDHQWAMSSVINAVNPLRIFRKMLPNANPGAAVCFFGGPNPKNYHPRYSAYASSKAMLREAVKSLQAEHPDMRIFVLDPGVVKTKILQVAADMGEPRAINILADKEPSQTFDQVYAKLKAHLEGR